MFKQFCQHYTVTAALTQLGFERVEEALRSIDAVFKAKMAENAHE
ncbi:MAG: hypothetical protein ACRCV9_08680 [Burkholderiaceae bacterium]